MKRACTVDSDCQCECKQGFYQAGLDDLCLPHSQCPLGQGVLSNGRLVGGEGWEEGSSSGQVQSRELEDRGVRGHITPPPTTTSGYCMHFHIVGT